MRILGIGGQNKSYIHVRDVLAAVLKANEKTTERFLTYNVATGDYITVREIAELACTCLGLDRGKVAFEFTGSERGAVRGAGWAMWHSID